VSEPSTITPLGSVRKRDSYAGFIAGVLIAGMVGLGLLFAVLRIARQHEQDRVRNLIGKTKQQVQPEMGRPTHVVAPGEPVEIPSEYEYVVPVPQRPARGEVLVYIDAFGATGTYIYLNERGIVEHVETAGN
jgi:hypothetical protein